MSHRAQRQYCLDISKKFSQYFKNTRVLDVGSLNINGDNRRWFEQPDYTGIDVFKGRNVDIVCPAHEFKSEKQFDVVISTECWEHDSRYEESVRNVIRLLKSGGLFVFTCATTGRGEHGTTQNDPKASPATNNYYKNLTEEDFRKALDFDKTFSQYEFNVRGSDIRFWGIKK